MTDTCPSPAVSTTLLTRRYGPHVAVDRVTVTVPRGTVAGLIGPNGAGKTTLMAMLLGLVRPTSGAATVLGRAPGQRAATGSTAGALIEAPAFHPGLDGVANLAYLARLGGHDPSRIPELLDLVGLSERREARYAVYSLGMKQRLGIAAALIGDPDLVVLDEPSNGVDPEGMRDIRRIIGEIAAQGRTILVSSHLLGELEQVCTWLVVLAEGRLVYEGPPVGLPNPTGDRLLLRPQHASDLTSLMSVLAPFGRWSTVDDAVVGLSIDGREPYDLAARVNHEAHAAGISLAEVRHDRADLETRYLALVHGGVRA
jgi:ABC-2 type transport system ATP-binding protein